MTTTIARPAPVFLRPTAREYAVDEVCAQITQALEARNWDVPGIKVEFSTYGSGHAWFRTLHTVRGKSYALRFNRSQGLNHGFYNTAAIGRIAILQKDIELYGDGSGPSLTEYIGELDAWEKDRKWFYSGYYSPRREGLLEFDGECRCGGSTFSRHTHTGVPAPFLVAKGDSDKEYETAVLLDEFANWLKDNVLTVIESYPETKPDFDRFYVADIPFPSDVAPIFSFAKYGDADRIRQAGIDISEIPMQNRYGLRREMSLVDLGVRDKHHPHDEAFREAGVWCGFGAIDASSTIKKSSNEPGLSIPDYYPHDAEFICRVTPNRANNIYVAEYAAYMTKRKEIEVTLGDRQTYTNEELREMKLAFARTLVPITEYDGSFEQPIVLIQRELDFDEVEVVAGPMTEHFKKHWREQEG